MWKHFVILGILFTVIAGYVFWRIYHEQQTSEVTSIPVDVERQSGPDNAESSDESAEELNKVQHLKQMARERRTKEQLASDRWQKKSAIMDTPEYAAFLETGPKSLYETLDFFASQGLEVDKNAFFKVFDEKFKEHFPGETPASAEPQIRQELIDRLDESDAKNHLQVAMDFVGEERYSAWGNLHFETDDTAFAKWTFDILQNYHQPAASTPVVETEEIVSTTQPLNADELLDDSSITESTESAVAPQEPSTEQPILEAGDVLTESDIDIDTEIQKLLDSIESDTSEFPSETDLEKHGVESDENFTSKRLNTAMQTLDRYGPAEGLRRLKESDPELATYIERYVQREQEKNRKSKLWKN